MAKALAPADARQLVEAIEWAVAGSHPLELVAGGTKRGLGRPVQSEATLDVSAMSGIESYEPAELVLTAKPGTLLADIEAAVAAAGQMLAFEPASLVDLLGSNGTATLGGVIAGNLSGPRRIKAGAARDHFLGLQAVSGRGEIFKAGGKVVKNVTGYDLCKLLAGSWGTLAVLAEVTIKVLPAPERTRTVLVFGLDDKRANEAMGAAMASAHEVSGAAHLPPACAARSAVSYVAGAGKAVTAVRVEGFGVSADARCQSLRDLLADYGPIEELHSKNSVTFWREVREVAPFVGDDRPVWRLSVSPAKGAQVVDDVMRSVESDAYFDWAGGLIWLATPHHEDAGESAIRRAVGDHGGHATLIRAAPDLRAALPVFQPQAPAVAALTARMKESFDPARVLNPGRMYAGV